MIAFLTGTLAAKTHDAAIVETAGIGYEVGMSSDGLSRLPEVGEKVQLHTYLQVREDALSLFGFLTLEEKTLFMRLISVSGIGPKVALSALSVFTPQDLITHITAQDVAAVSRIPGVGKKTASRIILELKGSLDKDLLAGEGGATLGPSAAIQATREALLSMGFSSEEADLALKNAPESADEAKLLQHALKRLGR